VPVVGGGGGALITPPQVCALVPEWRRELHMMLSAGLLTRGACMNREVVGTAPPCRLPAGICMPAIPEDDSCSESRRMMSGDHQLIC
jgi:hypothetical protein